MKRDPVLLLFMYTYIGDIHTTYICFIDTYRTVCYLSNKKSTRDYWFRINKRWV